MDAATLEKIKKELLAQKQRLEQELHNFATEDAEIDDNYKSKFPDYGDDEDENAGEVAEYSDRLSIEHALETQLRDVNKAIGHIEEGTYGVCKYCNNEIEPQRLMIRPTSTSCVACKKKLKGEA